jgi:hypothetical protein
VMKIDGIKSWLAGNCKIVFAETNITGWKRELIITSKSVISISEVNTRFKDCLNYVIKGTEPDQPPPAPLLAPTTPAAASKRCAAVDALESVETGGGDELREELRRSIIHRLELLAGEAETTSQPLQ